MSVNTFNSGFGRGIRGRGTIAVLALSAHLAPPASIWRAGSFSGAASNPLNEDEPPATDVLHSGPEAFRSEVPSLSIAAFTPSRRMPV